MSQIIPPVDSVEGLPCGINQYGKTCTELVLGIERLHHAQARQGLLHLAEYIRVLLLTTFGGTLQTAAYPAYQQTGYGQQYEHKQCQLPTDNKQRKQIHGDHNRILEQHVQRAHDTGFHLVDIVRHARQNIAFAFLREVSQRQTDNLIVQLPSQVA